jgi:phosphoribosyl 1,2-cyclic phosphate phosphodiesterase
MKIFRPHLVRRAIVRPFEIGGKTWTPIPLVHGEVDVLGFRIDGLAYCTDVNFIPESSFDFLHDLDVLVLDALQHRPHATHFSVSQALEVTARIGAKRTFFTHIAHGLSHEATSATFPENIRLAHDGLRVEV